MVVDSPNCSSDREGLGGPRGGDQVGGTAGSGAGRFHEMGVFHLSSRVETIRSCTGDGEEICVIEAN
jgi:hypothetical protein